MNDNKKVFLCFLCVILSATFLFAGCSAEENGNTTTENTVTTTENKDINNNMYVTISPKEAKSVMDSNHDAVILDVRTKDEYDEGHIENAVLIPDYEIEEKAPSMLKDKDAIILVYCRSGRRSKNAASALADMGYTNIKEFGGIIDWTYGTTK